MIKLFKGQKDLVNYSVEVAQKLGGVKEAILLSQIVYWSFSKKGEEFWKTDKLWSEELGLSKREVEGARKKLIRLNLIRTNHKKLEHKTYYSIIFENYNKFISDLYFIEYSFEKQVGFAGTEMVSPENENRNSGERKQELDYIKNTDTTSETTTDTPPKQKYPKDFNLLYNNFPHFRIASKKESYRNYKNLDYTFLEIAKEIEILNIEVSLGTINHNFTPAFQRWIKELVLSNEAKLNNRLDKIMVELYKMEGEERRKIFASIQSVFDKDMIKKYEKKQNGSLVLKFN